MLFVSSLPTFEDGVHGTGQSFEVNLKLKFPIFIIVQPRRTSDQFNWDSDIFETRSPYCLVLHLA